MLYPNPGNGAAGVMRGEWALHRADQVFPAIAMCCNGFRPSDQAVFRSMEPNLLEALLNMRRV
ncbi:MAG TPA: hypothetical protein VJ698_24515 [Noviherbaspirillum sp.]|uniref:hypothetical protein n=1 Tax=Noviherbaspirillum sp. TaxID=1926288 RepID=UPI002B4A5914|nr:hypothetical protein [Noviherbaspirillum sp.]HJV88652.1 hypothetical protein [Noviherbaspirillum sp.]